jgi:hypothetical protein
MTTITEKTAEQTVNDYKRSSARLRDYQQSAHRVVANLNGIFNNDWESMKEVEARTIELFVEIERIVDEYKKKHGREEP